MKQIKLVFALMILFLVFTGCSVTFINFKLKINAPVEYPYGIWQSENPRITLYIDPTKKDTPCTGIYILNNEEKKMWINFSSFNYAMVLAKEDAFVAPYDGFKSGSEYEYFSGTYIEKEDKLYYYIGSFKKIVFEKIGDY